MQIRLIYLIGIDKPNTNLISLIALTDVKFSSSGLGFLENGGGNDGPTRILNLIESDIMKKKESI